MMPRSYMVSVLVGLGSILGCTDNPSSKGETSTGTMDMDASINISSERRTDSQSDDELGTPTENTDQEAGSTEDAGIGTALSTEIPSDIDDALSCVGVRCNTPLANECSGTVNLTTYNSVGWCQDGECQYVGKEQRCEKGGCVNGICTSMPCQGVTCTRPPHAECIDGSTLRIYNSQGHCSVIGDTPLCEYASTQITCEGACIDSQCSEDPCTHVVCDDAPARYCDGDELVVWDTIPRCTLGECVYGEQRVTCGPQGCQDGRCTSDDPCAGIFCDIPPANFCSSDSILRVYDATGRCDEGVCLFNYETVTCAGGCTNGQCIGDKCIGVKCHRGPASRCLDGATLVGWNGEVGACTDGVCAYGVSQTVCTGECANGMCVENPCLGIHCLNPPTAYCLDETTLMTYAAQGVCQETTGFCSYEILQQTCSGICEIGDCVAPTSTDTEIEVGTDTTMEDTSSHFTETDSSLPSETGFERDTTTPPETDTILETPTDTASETDTLSVPIGPRGDSCEGGLDCGGFSCCETILVEGGTFMMGRSETPSDLDYYSNGSSNELPEHPVTVASFYLDKFEVTVGRFRKFLEAYDGTPPAWGDGAHPLIPDSGWNSGWNTNLYSNADSWSADLTDTQSNWTQEAGTREQAAVNFISWYDAFAFCAWDGGRLPTEAEWEYAAARGAENTLYPWGVQVPGSNRANYSDASGSLGRNVGSSPDGDGLWGHSDLSGSMEEWVLDTYSGTWYEGDGANCDNCANLASSGDKVRRGGCWITSVNTIRSTYRGHERRHMRFRETGIRCARDAPRPQ